MQSFKPFAFVLVALLTLASAGCSSWVYRINIPQGNFLEQKDVDRLHISMTREQVIFVLGKPVATDAFDKDTWHYLYTFNLDRASEQRQSLTLKFENDKLVQVISDDYEQPADFNTPLEQ